MLSKTITDGRKSYRAEKIIGVGSTSTCYLALDTETDERIVAKEIDTTDPRDKRIKETVENEVSIHRLLEHENVVTLIDFIEEESFCYILLEYCNNKSLDDLLRSSGTLTEAATRHYLRQVVLAVKYIHETGFVHRDLKPSNVLLSGNDVVKIGDFGLALSLGKARAETKPACGTVAFMAPEVLVQGRYGTESDVWAIGCMMFKMLFGITPFSDGSVINKDRIIAAEFTFPESLSDRAEDLIKKLLRANPEERLTLEELVAHEFFDVSNDTGSSFTSGSAVSTPGAAKQVKQRFSSKADRMKRNQELAEMLRKELESEQVIS